MHEGSGVLGCCGGNSEGRGRKEVERADRLTRGEVLSRIYRRMMIGREDDVLYMVEETGQHPYMYQDLSIFTSLSTTQIITNAHDRDKPDLLLNLPSAMC